MQEYVVMLVLSWVNHDSDFTLSFDEIHIVIKFKNRALYFQLCFDLST